MSDFLSGLVERVKTNPIEIAYSAIIFFGTVVCIFFTIRIALMIRRWYLKSLLRRQSIDYKTEVRYIKENLKPINRVQRFFLGQTGEILGFDIIVTIAILIIFSCLEVWVFSKLNFESIYVIWGFRLFSIGFLFYSIICLFVGLYDLVKYGRIITFLCSLLLIAIAGLCAYIYFFVFPI